MSRHLKKFFCLANDFAGLKELNQKHRLLIDALIERKRFIEKQARDLELERERLFNEYWSGVKAMVKDKLPSDFDPTQKHLAWDEGMDVLYICDCGGENISDASLERIKSLLSKIFGGP